MIAMAARTQKPADDQPQATAETPEVSEEQLQALQDAIDDAVAKALEEHKASAGSAAAPASVTTVDEGPQGREFLSKSDFVPVWDKDGQELPPVPKHWGSDQLPAGATKKKPAAKSDDSK